MVFQKRKIQHSSICATGFQSICLCSEVKKNVQRIHPHTFAPNCAYVLFIRGSYCALVAFFFSYLNFFLMQEGTCAS